MPISLDARMKKIVVLLAAALFIIPAMNVNAADKVLRHVVLFKFKSTATADDIKKIETEFRALAKKVPQVASYEWGTNNSPENLAKGFTHCFFITFKSEADRAVYLDHPDHKAFVKILLPLLEEPFVVDYWAQ